MPKPLRLWIYLPILPFMILVLQYAQNIPRMDDYETILQTVLDFKRTGDWSILLRQHNEHRILLTRGIALAEYYLTGSINFQLLIFLGACMLAASAVILAGLVQRYAPYHRNLLSFLACLLVMDLNTYESASWAMAGIQVYGTLLLVLVSLLLWHRKSYWLAIPVSILCILSSASGVIGVGAILGYYLLRKKWREAGLCASTTIVGVTVYLVGYHVVHQPGVVEHNPLTMTIYFVRQLGAPVSFDWSVPAGFIILALIPLSIFPKLGKEWPLRIVGLYALGCMLSSAVLRGCMPDSQFQTSRYLIYPQLVIAITLVLLVSKHPRRKFVVGVATTVLVVCYLLNLQFGQMGLERYSYRIQLQPHWHPNEKFADSIASRSCQEGVYCIEDHW